MSLYLGNIGTRIVERSITSPKLRKATNVVGKVLSTVSFGHYKVGLTRTAYLLSRQVKPGDVLKIQSGQVFKDGQPILSNSNIFKGINTNRLEVTYRMCTPEGMASCLRWDVISNVPSFTASLIPYVGSIYWLLTAFNVRPTISGVLTFLLSSISFLPYHKIGPFSNPRDQHTRLSDVDNYYARELHYSESSFIGATANPFIPGWVFINDRASGFSKGAAIAHEKSHLLGASEYRAHKIQREAMLKSVFCHSNTDETVLNRAIYLCKLLFWASMGHSIQNIESLGYAFMGIDYDKGYFDQAFLQLINDRGKLSRLIERFEKGEEKFDNTHAAIAYKAYGDLEKALFYYGECLIEVNAKLQRGNSIHNELQLIYLAIGLTLQEQDEIQRAIEAFNIILKISSSKGADPRLAIIAQAALDKININLTAN